MNRYWLYGYRYNALGILLLSTLSCFGRQFTVYNHLPVDIYCDLDSTTLGCHFHFDTNFPGHNAGAIPARKIIGTSSTGGPLYSPTKVINGTGSSGECELACYLNVKFKVVGERLPLYIQN